jgi:hypothetical protein
MARNENPPFPRGETFYNGGTIDTNNLGGTNLEGMEYEFEDLDLSTATGVKSARTNRKVRCRIVRNVSGIALTPKRLARYQATTYGARIDGYCAVGAQDWAGVVDEWLPAAGVPTNDLCWIVVKGPSNILTDLAGADNNVINQGDPLVALTAATSQATTAGRIRTPSVSASSTAYDDLVVLNEARNQVGRALSAKTTANTNADCLVEVGEW